MVSQVVCVCKRELEAQGLLLQQLWWGWLTTHCVRNAAHVSKCSVVLSRDKGCLGVISFFSFFLHKEFLTLKSLFHEWENMKSIPFIWMNLSASSGFSVGALQAKCNKCSSIKMIKAWWARLEIKMSERIGKVQTRNLCDTKGFVYFLCLLLQCS